MKKASEIWDDSKWSEFDMTSKDCCDFGEYSCQVPVAIKGKVQYIDHCIADIVSALNDANIKTVASCCGHNKIPGSIVLADGRELKIERFKPHD